MALPCAAPHQGPTKGKGVWGCHMGHLGRGTIYQYGCKRNGVGSKT